MVKLPFSGGSKRHASTTDSTIVVGSSRPSIRLHLRLGKNGRRAAVLLLLVIVLGLAAAVISKHSNSQLPKGATQIPMGQQYIQNQISGLKKNKPADSASLASQLSYYDTLMTTEASSGDYKGAVATYETRTRLSSEGISALQYFRVAQWYQQVGDKQGALGALNKSQTLVSNGSASDLPVEQFQASIDKLRQELST